MYVHCTQGEPQSHKDWLVTPQGVEQGVMQYCAGVANHPMIVFQAQMGRGWERDTQPAGHKPTGVNGYGAGDKQAWGAVMECVSGAGLTITQWVTMYREVVIAVEEQHIWRQTQHSVREAMQADAQGVTMGN